MPNANEPTGGNPQGSSMDSSQGTPQGGIPSGDPTGNSQAPGQQGSQDLTALQTENTRLKGQVSSLQKKYLDAVRGAGNQQPAPTGGEGDENFQTYEAALDLAGAKLLQGLEDIFSLYDGSNPDYKDQPTLTPAEVRMIRKNPWGFVSRATISQVMRTGNLQPALLEVEQYMADLVDSRTNSPVANAGGVKQVQPSAAPVQPSSEQSEGQDPWSMPMDQLEQVVAKERQVRSQQ